MTKPGVVAETVSAAASPIANLWIDDLAQLPPVEVDWLWQGYLARGAISLLTSQWKTGKTTLVSLLLARAARGGELAGLPVKSARAVILSEETPGLWRQRHERLHFGSNTCLICRPFGGKPTQQQWLELVEHVRALRLERGMDLLIVDPVSLLLPPFFESHAERMQAALLPLTGLTNLGMSVLLLHHPKKGDALAGQAARGSGALGAMVDILMELSLRRGAASEDRTRRLLAWSRYEQTTRELVMKLTDDGLDYELSEAETKDEPFEAGWCAIEALLQERTGEKLTRKKLHELWPQRHKPDKVTLWRWLDRAVSLRRLCQEGNGSRPDPYRYWLPGIPAVYIPDPFELLNL